MSHPPLARLLLFLKGEVPAAERRAIVRHLLARCPECVAVTRAAWAQAERLSWPRQAGERPPACRGFRRTRSRRGERVGDGEWGSRV